MYWHTQQDQRLELLEKLLLKVRGKRWMKTEEETRQNWEATRSGSGHVHPDSGVCRGNSSDDDSDVRMQREGGERNNGGQLEEEVAQSGQNYHNHEVLT